MEDEREEEEREKEEREEERSSIHDWQTYVTKLGFPTSKEEPFNGPPGKQANLILTLQCSLTGAGTEYRFEPIA